MEFYVEIKGDEDVVVIGFGIDNTYSNGGPFRDFARLPDLEKLKSDLQSFLEPFGCWDESQFGLHSILSEY